MKITNKIMSILIALLMLLNTTVVFAAVENPSYDTGYDAGYDYGYARQNSKMSAEDAYNDYYKDSRAHNALKQKIDNYVERDFRDGFIDGYRAGHDYKINANQVVEYASVLGRSLGEIYGAKASQSGKKSDWRAAVPEAKSLNKMYDLDKQTSAYRSKFIDEFTTAFNEGYNEAYDKAMYESTKLTLEQGVMDGQEIGTIVGAVYGSKDYYGGQTLNFKRNLPSNTEIIEQYALGKDNSYYEDGFISGFVSSYEISYNQAFREANIESALKKATSMLIPIAGGKVVTEDNRFEVNINSGTFYHDVSVDIVTTFDVKKASYSNLVKASDSYTVYLANLSENADESKMIELSFEYYGDKVKGGIYKRSGSRWLYIPTVIEDGKMTAKINPKSINTSGTVFSAFVDKNATVFLDARGHWASDEIDAYVRRGVISGYSDKTFRPDNNITRAEFLTLLSRVFNWNTSLYTTNATSIFKDSSTFGSYNSVINYATYNGIINGYGDNTFKPGNLISYAEVEIIMNRVLYNKNFKWTNIANSMLYDKKVRSNSLNNINDKITRAEVAYMLYSVTE